MYMYSKNDYRYYLENQLIHSDDFLAHYGVKGMKWRQHLKGKYKDATLEKNDYNSKDFVSKERRLDFNKHKHWSDGIGVRYTHDKKTGSRQLQLYDTTKTKYDKKKDDYVYEKKRRGRVTKSRAEDGVEYNIDLSRRKRYKKNQVMKTARAAGSNAYLVKWTAQDAAAAASKRKK